jgi:hypothetical protein
MYEPLTEPAPEGPLPQQFVRCRFDDDVWYCALAGGSERGMHWNRLEVAPREFLTDPNHADLLRAAKRLMILAAIARPGNKRRPLRGSSLLQIFNGLRFLLPWMVLHGVQRFSELTIDHLVRYRNRVERETTIVRHNHKALAPGSRKPLARHTRFARVQVLLYLVRLQDELRGDGIRLNVHDVEDVLAPITGDVKSDSSTQRIPDELFRQIICRAIEVIKDPCVAQVAARCDTFEAAWEDHRSRHPKSKLQESIRRGAFYTTNWRPKNAETQLITFCGSELDLAILGREALKDLITVVRGGCLAILAGLIGMRQSELRTLRIGCLRTRRLPDGRVLLAVHGTLFKTVDASQGENAEWVAGWDVPDNPVRLAIATLEMLSRAERTDVLFPRERRRLQYYDDYISVTKMAGLVRRFAVYVSVGDGWHFAMHQFRKTFARFVALSNVNASLALMRHFKHVSLQMTERYFPDDPELIGEIIEASEALIAERLDTVFGAERLGGIKGQEIVANNTAYRGDAHAKERRELVEMSLRDPSVRVLLHLYGLCIYDESAAKCRGDIANVGMWTCVDCPNSVMDETAEPFWKETIRRLDEAIALREQVGFVDLELIMQRERAVAVLEGLKGGDRQTA